MLWHLPQLPPCRNSAQSLALCRYLAAVSDLGPGTEHHASLGCCVKNSICGRTLKCGAKQMANARGCDYQKPENMLVKIRLLSSPSFPGDLQPTLRASCCPRGAWWRTDHSGTFGTCCLPAQSDAESNKEQLSPLRKTTFPPVSLCYGKQKH